MDCKCIGRILCLNLGPCKIYTYSGKQLMKAAYVSSSFYHIRCFWHKKQNRFEIKLAWHSIQCFGFVLFEVGKMIAFFISYYAPYLFLVICIMYFVVREQIILNTIFHFSKMKNTKSCPTNNSGSLLHFLSTSGLNFFISDSIFAKLSLVRAKMELMFFF